MEKLISALQRFRQELTANPAVEVVAQDLPHLERCLRDEADADYLAASKKRVETGAGIALSVEDANLFALPAEIDIAWTPVEPASDYVNHVQGEINLISPTSLLGVRYQLSEPGPDNTWLDRPLYYFDPGHSLDNHSMPTVLCYDRATQCFEGLAIALDKERELVPLQLSFSEYASLALTWYGASGWPLLYLSLDKFKDLPFYVRRCVYAFPRRLPVLFPNADWSILATKTEYFATEPVSP